MISWLIIAEEQNPQDIVAQLSVDHFVSFKDGNYHDEVAEDVCRMGLWQSMRLGEAGSSNVRDMKDYIVWMVCIVGSACWESRQVTVTRGLNL